MRKKRKKTKRHITTSSSSVNTNEGADHSMGPNTIQPTTPITTQEHEESQENSTDVDTTEHRLVRGYKRNTRTWDVQIKDVNGQLKRQKMRAIDIFSLPPGERVVVEWNFRNHPVEFSGGMLAQFLGHIASNWENFPIGYEKWQKIPRSYKNHVWNNIIKPKLEVNDDGHKDYIFKSLAKKWWDHRCHLYSYAQCDPDATREMNIAKKPPEIPLEQWVAFVDYRAHPGTKAKVAQNTRNRMNLTMPHTLGSKSFARLEKEMETQLGRSVTRAELFQASHTTLEGSFVNEEAKENHEDLINRGQNSSKNEAFTSVFGKNHSGYIRGLGLGVSPTQVYGSSSSSSDKCYASGGNTAELNALKEMVQQLSKQVQQNQDQIAFLSQQLANQNANLTPDQENVGSPVSGRRSSQGSYSGCGGHNSDHIA